LCAGEDGGASGRQGEALLPLASPPPKGFALRNPDTAAAEDVIRADAAQDRGWTSLGSRLGETADWWGRE